MSLKEKLQGAKQQMAEQLPGEILQKFGASLQSLVDSGLAAKALKAQDKAPLAVLKDADGQDVDLRQLLDKGPLVLVFYRGLWCPFCNLALSAYQQMVGDLAASGATLVAVSPQTPQSSAKTREALGIRYLLLSDPENRLAKQYGIVFKLEDELDAVYRSLGADLKVFNASHALTLPMASAFVIGQDGVIRHAFVNVDYSERVEPQTLIEAVGR
ncbi:peroxiredoxin-like family protein [Pseudomonas saponiphila]|uniref:peroxiredoxin-like family protein n=1 Tax=Pseudomonas saponiphila TaxID=556534 RepID=UPI00223F6ACB|nr:peroxiredoxin-like family protein [Pseudomonas saponiphila]